MADSQSRAPPSCAEAAGRKWSDVAKIKTSLTLRITASPSGLGRGPRARAFDPTRNAAASVSAPPPLETTTTKFASSVSELEAAAAAASLTPYRGPRRADRHASPPSPPPPLKANHDPLSGGPLRSGGGDLVTSTPAAATSTPKRSPQSPPPSDDAASVQSSNGAVFSSSSSSSSTTRHPSPSLSRRLSMSSSISTSSIQSTLSFNRDLMKGPPKSDAPQNAIKSPTSHRAVPLVTPSPVPASRSSPVRRPPPSATKFDPRNAAKGPPKASTSSKPPPSRVAAPSSSVRSSVSTPNLANSQASVSLTHPQSSSSLTSSSAPSSMSRTRGSLSNGTGTGEKPLKHPPDATLVREQAPDVDGPMTRSTPSVSSAGETRNSHASSSSGATSTATKSVTPSVSSHQTASSAEKVETAPHSNGARGPSGRPSQSTSTSTVAGATPRSSKSSSSTPDRQDHSQQRQPHSKGQASVLSIKSPRSGRMSRRKKAKSNGTKSGTAALSNGTSHSPVNAQAVALRRDQEKRPSPKAARSPVNKDTQQRRGSQPQRKATPGAGGRARNDRFPPQSSPVLEHGRKRSRQKKNSIGKDNSSPPMQLFPQINSELLNFPGALPPIKYIPHPEPPLQASVASSSSARSTTASSSSSGGDSIDRFSVDSSSKKSSPNPRHFSPRLLSDAHAPRASTSSVVPPKPKVVVHARRASSTYSSRSRTNSLQSPPMFPVASPTPTTLSPPNPPFVLNPPPLRNGVAAPPPPVTPTIASLHIHGGVTPSQHGLMPPPTVLIPHPFFPSMSIRVPVSSLPTVWQAGTAPMRNGIFNPQMASPQMGAMFMPQTPQSTFSSSSFPFNGMPGPPMQYLVTPITHATNGAAPPSMATTQSGTTASGVSSISISTSSPMQSDADSTSVCTASSTAAATPPMAMRPKVDAACGPSPPPPPARSASPPKTSEVNATPDMVDAACSPSPPFDPMVVEAESFDSPSPPISTDAAPTSAFSKPSSSQSTKLNARAPPPVLNSRLLNSNHSSSSSSGVERKKSRHRSRLHIDTGNSSDASTASLASASSSGTMSIGGSSSVATLPTPMSSAPTTAPTSPSSADMDSSRHSSLSSSASQLALAASAAAASDNSGAKKPPAAAAAAAAQQRDAAASSQPPPFTLPAPPRVAVPSATKIPDGPVVSLDVHYVATGYRHDQRSVGQISLVDTKRMVLCNLLITQEEPVVSYLYALTGLSEALLKSRGIPLDTAMKVVRANLSKDTVLVGHNVRPDIDALGLVEGEDYAVAVDLSDLWSVWNQRYSAFSKFSLNHIMRNLFGKVPVPLPGFPVVAELAMDAFMLHQHAQQAPAIMGSCQQRLLSSASVPAFHKQHPYYDNVCMGNRRLCRCNAPFP